MRVEGMDAQKVKFVDRAPEVPLPVQNQQKTVPGKKTEDNKTEVISDRVVIGAIEKANKAMVAASRELEFTIHEKTKEIMVKVIDTETKEVIREIPS